MRKAIIFIIIFALICITEAAIAQVQPFTCIGPGSTCPDTTQSLRGNSTAYTAVSVAGWLLYGDGGAGDFHNIGTTGGAHPVCVSETFSSSPNQPTGTVGTTTINLQGTDNTTGLVVGELVTGSGTGISGTVIQIQPGAEIASITPPKTFNLTLPLVGNASGPTSLNVSTFGDNHGTLIVDAAGDCYLKTNYRGDPREWGAFGDNSHDDTTALQNWLGAYGNVSGSLGLTSPTAPPNFGRWVASIPGSYQVSQPLSCPANTTIQGSTNVDNGGTPRVQIVADPTFHGLLGDSATQAVMGAHAFCKISGIAISAGQPFSEQGMTTGGSNMITGLGSTSSINYGNTVYDADNHIPPNTIVTGIGSGSVTISNNATGSGTDTQKITFSGPISLSGTTTLNSTTISNLSYVGGINVGNAVTDANNYIPANSSVQTISSLPCPCSVTFVNPSSMGATTTASETINFWNPDAVDVLGNALKVTIDGSSALQYGRYNVDCGDNGQVSGLEAKDIELESSTSDNVHIAASCGNVRLVGDNITNSRGNGVVFADNDLTLADGIIQQNGGAGLVLADTAHAVSVTGMSFQQNGQASAGPAIQIGDSSGAASWITICGNHFYESGYNSAGLTTTSHILFVNGSYLNLCGNVYRADSTYGPAYAYDAISSTVSLPNTGIYESAQPQNVGIFTVNAAAALPSSQVAPSPRAFITGLGLSNGASSNTRLVVAPGSATDSTGVAVITIPSGGCTVNISNEYLEGLDSVSYPKQSSTTYFFFVVADETGANATTSPNCIASKNTYPSFTGTGYTVGIYRLVGALYTDSSTHMVQFQQDVDTFYLDNPAADVSGVSIGSTAGTVSLASVPTGISVEALGRCIATIPSGTSPYVLMFTPPPSGITPVAPHNFPTVPGYAMKAQVGAVAGGVNSFPYRLYTDTATHIEAQASASATLDCMTDGWVLHRQQ